MVEAGRMAPKTSPWARPISSQSSAWARKMRVRTTCSNVAPAWVRAASISLRTTRVCSAGERSSAPTGPVPETWTTLPMRTAREKPMMGS